MDILRINQHTLCITKAWKIKEFKHCAEKGGLYA